MRCSHKTNKETFLLTAWSLPAPLGERYVEYLPLSPLHTRKEIRWSQSAAADRFCQAPNYYRGKDEWRKKKKKKRAETSDTFGTNADIFLKAIAWKKIVRGDSLFNFNSFCFTKWEGWMFTEGLTRCFWGTSTITSSHEFISIRFGHDSKEKLTM